MSNNLPRFLESDFTFTGDTATIAFTDLSTGIADQWHWDFGDGSSSDEANPIHTFPNPGPYTVTLTVSNDCETKTSSQVWEQIIVNTTLVGDDVQLYPNPIKDKLQIKSISAILQSVRFYNAAGKLLMERENLLGDITFDLSEWQSGFYFVELIINGERQFYKLSKI